MGSGRKVKNRANRTESADSAPHFINTADAVHTQGQLLRWLLLQRQYILTTEELLQSHQPWQLHQQREFSRAPARLPIALPPLEEGKQAGTDMPDFPFQSDQRGSSCESPSHSPLPRLSNTVAFKLHVSCLARVVFTLLQGMLQATKRKGSTDLQQLNFWLDRRFGSSERFRALTWFQHLPENRFSIHLYPLLWSTSTWAACSQVPAQIWASGAAPAVTAGIHPGKAIPTTSCHGNKNQQTLRKGKNSSCLPHFPKGEWTAPRRLEEEV